MYARLRGTCYVGTGGLRSRLQVENGDVVGTKVCCVFICKPPPAWCGLGWGDVRAGGDAWAQLLRLIVWGPEAQKVMAEAYGLVSTAFKGFCLLRTRPAAATTD